MHVAQFAFAPVVQKELGVLRKLEIANPVNNAAKLLAANPWEWEDVHPDLQRQPFQLFFHSARFWEYAKI